MFLMCFFPEHTNKNLHYEDYLYYSSSLPMMVFFVSWWSDLSFLSHSDLKKYLKLCSNISGQVKQMRTQSWE